MPFAEVTKLLGARWSKLTKEEKRVGVCFVVVYPRNAKFNLKNVHVLPFILLLQFFFFV